MEIEQTHTVNQEAFIQAKLLNPRKEQWSLWGFSLGIPLVPSSPVLPGQHEL